MLDDKNLMILRCLQENSHMPLQEIARKTALSIPANRQRLKDLKDNGYIKSHVVILDGGKLGFSLTAFLMLRVNNHSSEGIRRLTETISQMVSVVSFFQITGEFDFLLKVLVSDIEAYDEFYRTLSSSVTGVSKIVTLFSIDTIKDSVQLPL